MAIPAQDCGGHDDNEAVCSNCGLDHAEVAAGVLAALIAQAVFGAGADAGGDMVVEQARMPGLVIVRLNGPARYAPNVTLGPMAARLARQRRPDMPSWN